ncbi:hypothetical protein MRY82_02085 [bacterium]|nr:hypothetical protein [bacterium]
MSEQQTEFSLKNCFLFFFLLQFFVFLFFYIGIKKTESKSQLYTCSEFTIKPIETFSSPKTKPSPQSIATLKKEHEIIVTPKPIKKNNGPQPEYSELNTTKPREDTEIDIVNPDVKHSPDYTRDFLINHQCPVINCIEMSLNFKDKNDANFNVQKDADGQNLYTFKIRAKHKDNRSFKFLNAIVQGKLLLSQCSSLGNTNVAVLGFTPSKNPIISTQRGPIIVQDNNVSIGKKEGFKIFRNQKLIQKVTSPKKNLLHKASNSIIFHLNPNGQLFFTRAGSNQCIAYSEKRTFQTSPAKHCNFRLEKDPNHSAKFEQSANEQFHIPANNNNNYTVAIYNKNCR